MMITLSSTTISASVAALDLSKKHDEHKDSEHKDDAHGEKSHSENTPFDKTRDASADVDAAMAKVAENGKMAIIIMGANWCHDSRALAKWFASERFQAMLAPKYEIVYVDVGVPQTGNGRNIHIAKRFGIKKIKGTPTVAIISSEGKILNKKNAPKWRNADSRSEDDIFDHFANFNS